MLWREGNGTVHLDGGDGNDLTFCGYALEGACLDDEDEACIPVTRGRINCQKCLQMIRLAKSIPARRCAS